MSKGVLLVAIDSVTDQGTTIPYSLWAESSIRLIKHYLKLPCAVITNKSSIKGADEIIEIMPSPLTERTINVDGIHQTYTWYNDWRRQAFDLTPFDQTLMMDVDFLVQSSRLLEILDRDFTMVGKIYDPFGKNNKAYQYLENKTVPQCWATVMCWNKNAKPIFEYANMIADNYPYYAGLFGFSPNQFRNDHVFSIARHVFDAETIPWMIPVVDSKTNFSVLSAYSFLLQREDDLISMGSDFHIMNKKPSFVTLERVIDEQTRV